MEKKIGLIVAIILTMVIGFLPEILVALSPEAPMNWMVNNGFAKILFRGIAIVISGFLCLGFFGEKLIEIKDKFKRF